MPPKCRASSARRPRNRRIHERYNAQLQQQGLVNSWEPRIVSRRGQLEALDVRNWVAVTAATEHLTAVFSDLMLAHPAYLDGAEPRLRDLWLWHCSEESEHRSTAFDIYRALGGADDRRCRIFEVVARNFAIDLARQMLRNLWHAGTWWRPSTWMQGWRLLFGPAGFITLGREPARRYLRADFHPAQGDVAAAAAWLRANAALAPAVRQTSGAAA